MSKATEVPKIPRIAMTFKVTLYFDIGHIVMERPDIVKQGLEGWLADMGQPDANVAILEDE